MKFTLVNEYKNCTKVELLAVKKIKQCDWLKIRCSLGLYICVKKKCDEKIQHVIK